MAFAALLIPFLSLFLYIRPIHATCYFLDGITVSNDQPCDSTAAISPCCAAGGFCLDNGLCFDHGVTSRGSCTDQNWGAPCRKVCEDWLPTGGMPLTPCGDEFTYACGLPTPGTNSGNSGNCSNNITVPYGGQIVLRADQVANLGISSALTLGPTGTVPVSSCAATVTAGLRFSTVSFETWAGEASTSSNVGAIAGGTVGGIAGAALLVAAVILSVRRHKKRKAGATKQSGAPMKSVDADGRDVKEPLSGAGAAPKLQVSHELDGSRYWPPEIDSRMQPAELDS
ncbi:hypothetical protein PRZ48_011561 [Zasmidium cellare]|uniref:Uncharacterized protein n=1 Tax=Zasmidium cellare TaxID=395010 RepID=A0ABR0E7C3_ZASCE|nr:hypothetical protein PRZ48_011561 [Zasmidium cellare]